MPTSGRRCPKRCGLGCREVSAVCEVVLVDGRGCAVVNPRAVGKHDNRNSMKMKRRKGQAKKKARLKRQKLERKKAGASSTPRKTSARKAPKAAPAAAAPAPASTPAVAPPEE